MPALKTVKDAHLTRSLVRPGERSRGRYLTMRVASVADAVPAWGSSDRDKKMRALYRQIDEFSSAVYTMSAKYAGLPYTIQGKGAGGAPRTEAEVKNMFALSEHGKGWNALWSKTLVDSFTCDNAGWIELYRDSSVSNDARPIDPSTWPVVQLNNLDSLRCHRTGKWEQPIDYEDAEGHTHHLQWYDVLEVNDFPQPDEAEYGRGFCAFSRVLRAAQIMRDIQTYNHEKVSGQFNKRITVVNGLGPRAISDVLEEQRVEARNQGLMRFIMPVIMSSIDPRAPLSKIDIDLAALPEGWNEDIFMNWFVWRLGLAFGEDPQEFGLMPGSNMGSSQQSEIFHLKGENKGPNQFTSGVESQFNFLGIIPGNVEFFYGQKDSMISVDEQRTKLMRAQEITTYVKGGILTPLIAAKMLVQEGTVPREYLDDLVAQLEALANQQQASAQLALEAQTAANAQPPNRTAGGMTNSTTQPPASTARTNGARPQAARAG